MTPNERILNSKSRFVRISSEDKSTGTNNRFTVDLASNGGIIDNVKGFIVHSAQVPNIFYNVPEGKNEIAVFRSLGAQTSVITITPGQYTINDLLTELSTKITANIPDTCVVTFNNISQRLTFTFTGSSYKVLYGSSMRDILGIAEQDDDVSSLVVTLSYPVNLTGETECYIHSRILASNNLSEASGTFSVVDKINLDKPYGAICYSNYNNDTTHQVNYFPFENKKTLRTVDINLRSRTGELLVLPDNFTFTMMIKIFFE